MNGLFFFILGIMVFDYVSSHRMNKQKKFEKKENKMELHICMNLAEVICVCITIVIVTYIKYK